VVKKNASRKEKSKTILNADLTKYLWVIRAPFEKGLTHQESTPVKGPSPQLNLQRLDEIGFQFQWAGI
jgi:hypothetical protein